MTLQESNNIIQSVNDFLDLVNNTIGKLRAEKIINQNEISIQIINYTSEKNNVADFLYEKTYKNIQQNQNNGKIFYIGTCQQSFCGIMERVNFTITYDATYNTEVIKILTNALYFAVDEAKVEFNFYIEYDEKHIVPNEILYELDVWNDGWIEDGEEDKYVSADNLKTYKFKKDWLYSICLGYYSIDLSLFESDIVPELIGIIFNSTEDFCYVTSYEDKNWVYIYSANKLNEDNIFDIEEGLFNILSLISPTIEQCNLTLEDYYSIINKEG